MSLAQRHPFRSYAGCEAQRPQTESPGMPRGTRRAAPLRSPRRVAKKALAHAASSDTGDQPRSVCIVQGDQCSPSAFFSMAALASHLASSGHVVHVLTPDSCSPCEEVAPLLHRLPWSRFHSAPDLRRAVVALRPVVIVLSSHDACFESLRRDPRTVRWTHEVPRCYDPQASRCMTPLFATGGRACAHLPGFVDEARAFWDWSALAAAQCEYTPGPVRVCGLGHTYDPRSNFKAFQVLVEKYSTVQFIWVGASCNKHWHNLELLTADTDFAEVLVSCDTLIWCPDGDPCPVAVFQALYLGVRVHLFQKAFPFNLPRLCSTVDGSALLEVSSCAPQHAPLHVTAKNPKRPEDIERAREYVLETIASPPRTLVSAIEARLERATHLAPPRDDDGARDGTTTRQEEDL